MTDFNYATLTSLYIFKKTVECKLPFLRLCHQELTASAKTLDFTIQPNLMPSLLRTNLGHKNISKVEEILSHRMKGYKQMNVE